MLALVRSIMAMGLVVRSCVGISVRSIVVSTMVVLSHQSH
jgi:hypothetical protein